MRRKLRAHKKQGELSIARIIALLGLSAYIFKRNGGGIPALSEKRRGLVDKLSRLFSCNRAGKHEARDGEGVRGGL